MKPVLIIGGGIAGLSAAITLAEQGQESFLISSMPSERAQSVMAEGGINAALNTKGQQDTPEEHFRDTMAAGCDLADPNAVRGMTHTAPWLVRGLAARGVAFHRTEAGDIDLRPFGGQKKQRTAFVKSSTGKQITAVLIREARRFEAKGLIRRLSHHELQKVVTNGEKCCTGCIIKDNYTNSCQFLAGNVLFATGGLNGLFGKTTGTTQNSGRAAAAAFAAGAAFANLEMIQYHPTTVACSGKRMLISEAARGEGGRLFAWRNGEKWYFMEENYPELKNLMPRDVVSREIDAVCRKLQLDQVFLDLTELPERVFAEKLSDLRDFCMEFLHIDPKAEPVPVAPGIHYFMGGLYVDARHRTTLPGLYAAGECACQYHGANRLGGNSLLGALYGGRVAAETVLSDAVTYEPTEDAETLWKKEVAAVEARQEGCSCAALHQEAVELLRGSLGIRREEGTLQMAAASLNHLWKEAFAGRDPAVSPEEQLLEEQRLSLAFAMVESAAARKESRGGHFRTDYPARNDALFRKTTVALWKNNGVQITFAEIPEEEKPCIN